jgi:hypothetical protein
VAVLVGMALIALPVGAAIKAMTLAETMEINTDVLQGRILGKTTVKTDQPLEGMVYTHMTVQGESLTTGEQVTKELVFLGSHDPKDNYGTSEMPTLQDTRPGSEVLVFFHADKTGATPVDRVFDLGAVYRVEQTFGAPVVIGKGEGFAFPENVKLVSARDQIRKTHAELQAAKAQAGK